MATIGHIVILKYCIGSRGYCPLLNSFAIEKSLHYVLPKLPQPPITVLAPNVYQCIIITVNVERFTGLNFCVYCSFQGYREIFSVNIHLALYNGVV